MTNKNILCVHCSVCQNWTGDACTTGLIHLSDSSECTDFEPSRKNLEVATRKLLDFLGSTKREYKVDGGTISIMGSLQTYNALISEVETAINGIPVDANMETPDTPQFEVKTEPSLDRDYMVAEAKQRRETALRIGRILLVEFGNDQALEFANTIQRMPCSEVKRVYEAFKVIAGDKAIHVTLRKNGGNVSF